MGGEQPKERSIVTKFNSFDYCSSGLVRKYHSTIITRYLVGNCSGMECYEDEKKKNELKVYFHSFKQMTVVELI